MKRPPVISVFGSGLPRFGDSHYAEARQLGTELAQRGFVVCTGGYRGVMEAASRGAKEAGGQTIGVTAEFFPSRANKWVDQEIRVERWRDRLFELVDRAHGYVVCRGGTGTLVELAVVWEMLNKGVMKSKPLVAIGEFWRPVVKCVAEVERNRNRASRKLRNAPVHFAASASDAADYLASHFPKAAPSRSALAQSTQTSSR
jgi:uncharacterized protein (TIGR00725 family)